MGICPPYDAKDDVLPTLWILTPTLSDNILISLGATLDGDKQEGKEEGKQEGKQEDRQEIALRMLRKNMPLETIAELTELKIEQL